MFVEAGFRQAVIQKQDITQTQLSTLFYLSVPVAVLLTLVISAISPFVETFYRIVNLSHYLITVSVVLVLNAMTIVPSSLLYKDLRLRTMALVNLGSAMISGAIAMTLQSWIMRSGHSSYNLSSQTE